MNLIELPGTDKTILNLNFSIGGNFLSLSQLQNNYTAEKMYNLYSNQFEKFLLVVPSKNTTQVILLTNSHAVTAWVIAAIIFPIIRKIIHKEIHTNCNHFN